MTDTARFISSPVDPWAALLAGLRLIEAKEDTTAAHRFAIALDGMSMEAHFRAYAQHHRSTAGSPELAALIARLSDAASLRQLSPGSLGNAYIQYMDRNSLNFSDFIRECTSMHQGYYSKANASEVQRNWFMTNNICHDFFHVLGGYDIDALGELCVQSFFSGQSGSRAAWMLARIGMVVAAAAAPGIGAFAMVRCAYRQGVAAGNFALVDWTKLLGEPLDSVRASLNISPNPAYAGVPKARLDAILAGKEPA